MDEVDTQVKDRTKNLIPYKPGQSGNPGGMPKGLMRMVREACLEGKPLVDFMMSVSQGKVKGSNLRYRIQAVEWLADRGWGKAVQQLNIGDADGKPIFTAFHAHQRPATDADLSASAARSTN